MAGVLDWQENYVFPAKGTLSVTMLNKVKESMEKHEEKLKSKNKKQTKYEFQIYKIALHVVRRSRTMRKKMFRESSHMETQRKRQQILLIVLHVPMQHCNV